MSDSESLFVESSSESSSDRISGEDDEGQVIHDDFVDSMAQHQDYVRMDFDKWMTEVIVIMLNTTKEREWPVALLKNSIDSAAKKHAQMRGHTRNAQLQLNEQHDHTKPDEPEKYELIFTARELEACANLSASEPFSGSRNQACQDRLYSLLRHKVLGQGPLKLHTALRQRRDKRANTKKRQEAKQRAAAEAAEERARCTVRASGRNTGALGQREKSPREISNDETNSLCGVAILGHEEIRATLGENWLESTEDSDVSDNETHMINPVRTTQPRSPAAKRPKVNVCFRPQTTHDRRKMQPAVSKDDRIKQLKKENEKLQATNRKLRSRVEKHKRARGTAEVAQRNAERREASANRKAAQVQAMYREKADMLHTKEVQLERKASNLSELNSKVAKDFW